MERMMMMKITSFLTDERMTVTSLMAVFLVIFLLLLIVFVFLCRPWPFFSAASSFRRSSISIASQKTDDIERPLFSEDSINIRGQNYDLPRDFVEETSIQIDRNIISPSSHGLGSKKRIHTDSHVNQVTQGDNLVLDVISDMGDDPQVNLTLKRTAVLSRPVEDAKHVKGDVPISSLPFFGDKGRAHLSAVKAASKDIGFLRSSLNLEVIAGPARGLSCSRSSANTSMLSVTIGRVPPSDLTLKDSEVSGKHAIINWDINKLKWELMDMGSLNGTFLNSKAINHLDSSSRNWSEPVLLANGDIITLGTSSKISVQISQQTEHGLPSGVGVASDPMSIRRGGKLLPMEDMCYFQCPLAGVEQFGLFCIFDGHGGAAGARTASNVRGKQITMTEDHRVVGIHERTRFMKMGMPMKDGESRLCGINIGRMLGDKFLKEQDSRFSAEPYLSQIVNVSKGCKSTFALLASDGLWDVISIKKAVQLIIQAKDKYNVHDKNSADRVANYILGEARSLRTKDNTTVIFLDFDFMRISLSNIHS